MLCAVFGGGTQGDGGGILCPPCDVVVDESRSLVGANTGRGNLALPKHSAANPDTETER